MESKPFHISDYSLSCLLRRLGRSVWCIALGAVICGLLFCLGDSIFPQTPSCGSVTLAVVPTETGTLSPGRAAAVLSEMFNGPRTRRDLQASDPRLDRFAGTMTAIQVDATNYLVLTVQDRSPEQVLLMLEAAARMAPDLAAYTAPGCEVLVLRAPSLREASDRSVSAVGRFVLGALAGAMAVTFLLLWRFIARQTIQTPFGAQRTLNAPVLAVVPREPRGPDLSQAEVNAEFSEQIQNICSRIVHESAARGSKIFLFAGTGAGEGCTTLAANVAAGLTRAGNRVAMGDTLPDTAESFDYVILDAPPLDHSAQGELLAQRAHASILVVGQDVTPAPEIQDQIRLLQNTLGKFLGIVLNGMSDPLPGNLRNSGGIPSRKPEIAGKEVR